MSTYRLFLHISRSSAFSYFFDKSALKQLLQGALNGGFTYVGADILSCQPVELFCNAS